MFNKKRLIVFAAFLVALFFMTMYAGGTPQTTSIATNTVKFIDGYNNAEISSQEVKIGEEAKTPEEPSHRGMLFIGWYNGEDRITNFKNITANMTLTARYATDANNNQIADADETPFTVTFFDTVADNNISTVSVLSGLNATAPSPIVHDGYTFTGWSRGFTNVTSNITVNAQYRTNEELATITTYTVTFIADGKVISTQTIESGNTATAPEATTITKKVFTNWDVDFSNVTGNLTVTAVYADDLNGNGLVDATETKYTVTFATDDNGKLIGETEFSDLLIGLSLKDNKVVIPKVELNEGYDSFEWDVKNFDETYIVNGTATYIAAVKDTISPIARISSPETDYLLFGGNSPIIITGEVDESEKNIKSHWFEITNPNKEKITYASSMNTNSLNHSFELNTDAGSGIYKVRYVATDKYENRSDSPNYKNSTIRYIEVDLEAPKLDVWFEKVANTTIYKKDKTEVMLYFTSSEELDKLPKVTIGGKAVNVVNNGNYGKGVYAAYLYLSQDETPEGNLEINISDYTDKAGNIGETITKTTNNTKVIVDYTLPELSIKENDGTIYTIGNNTQNVYSLISFKLFDNVSVKEIKINGQIKPLSYGMWSDANFIAVGIDGAKYGENIITLSDLAGNETSFKFVLDNKGPNITVKEELDKTVGTISENTFSKVSFKLFDEYLINEVELNGQVFDKSDNDWSDHNFVEIGKNGGVEGKNIIIARDISGNESSYEFILDNTAPYFEIKENSIGKFDKNVFQVLNLKLKDNYKVKETVLNGKIKQVTFNNTSDYNNIKVGSGGAVYGKNIIILRDVAGNEISYKFYLDNKGPTISIIDGSIGDKETKTYSKVSFGLYDEFEIKGYEINDVYIPLDINQWSNINYDNIKGFLIEGSNTLKVYDLVGNFTTYEFNYDKTTPTFNISYSTTELTKDNVLVTLKFSEEVKSLTDKGWVQDKTDKTIWTKTYTNNANESVNFEDLAGNKGDTINISVNNIDKEAPVITFSGDNPLILGWGDRTFHPLRNGAVKAIDNRDGDITNKVKVISNNLNVYRRGTYTIEYEVTDAAGNITTAERIVIVKFWYDL